MKMTGVEKRTLKSDTQHERLAVRLNEAQVISGLSRSGLYRLGDQAVVIPSFTGDGVALALASGSLAARMWLNGESSDTYQRRFAHDVSAQMRSAVAIHRLALARVWRPWLMIMCGMWPGLISFVAQQTRVAALTDSGYAL